MRLVVHIATSAFIVYHFLSPGILFSSALPTIVERGIFIICLVSFLNIYNFLDGIDGITASESIHLSITILILCWLSNDIIAQIDLIIAVATLVLACSVAFMYHNWHPAKIFLGDVGSITLGLLLGLCLMLIASSSLKLLIACIIACLYYIADGGITILIRLLRREKIWLPHLNHFFQKAVRLGMSHKEITLKIALCNFSLMLLSISALYFPIVAIILAILVIAITLIHFSS
jgi:UDP-N-acetylmuramyl pentapeptide phosphotransferase/UDP-N-acetylglucosamine-1-phosphate transferase